MEKGKKKQGEWGGEREKRNEKKSGRTKERKTGK